MDTEHLNEEPEEWEFRSKPVWQRMIVISAGVIFNMILAAIIFGGIVFAVGEQRIPNESVPGIYVPDSSLVRDVGFRTGDKLVAVNNEQPKYFWDFFSSNQLMAPELTYTVLRDGQKVTLTMPDSLLDQLNDRGFFGDGPKEGRPMLPTKISKVLPDTPAEQAGLQKGDKIVAINGEPVRAWSQLVEHVETAKDTLQLTISRGNATFKVAVMPNENNKIGIGGPVPAEIFGVEYKQYGLFGSLGQGVEQTKKTTVGIIRGFQKMFSGDISVRENLGGPVAIANITKEQTERRGWLGFWNITAFLSVTLAIMNILPIPALDGGHLMFLFYEGITRREPSEKVRMAMQQIGFIVLMLLILVITFNDILRLF